MYNTHRWCHVPDCNEGNIMNNEALLRMLFVSIFSVNQAVLLQRGDYR